LGGALPVALMTACWGVFPIVVRHNQISTAVRT
jgi:hypothetical protein